MCRSRIAACGLCALLLASVRAPAQPAADAIPADEFPVPVGGLVPGVQPDATSGSGFAVQSSQPRANDNAAAALMFGLEAQEYALMIATAAGMDSNSNAALENAERAIGFARRALQLDNTTSVAYSALGLAYRDTWRWDRAQAAYEHGYAVAPDDPGIANGFASFSDFSGDYVRAIGIAQRSTALSPYSAAAHRDLGVAFAFAGNARAASAALRQCIAFDPRLMDCQRYLGVTLARMGDRQGAQMALDEAETLLGDNLTPWQAAWLAAGYAAAGARDEAERLFSRIEAMAQERVVGEGTWPLAYLAIGEVGEAYIRLGAAVDKAERGEPDEGFLALMMIKHNLADDRALEQSRFRELRSRIGGIEE